jgi:hypothetical protein
MKTMKETSWRTLMLMTTVLILVIVFEGTVRPYKPKTPLIGPAMGGYPPADPNKMQEGSPTRSIASGVPDKPAPSEPEPVMTVAEARPVWLNDNLGDLNEMGWTSRSKSDDPDESSPPESDDPNRPMPPVPE